MRELAGWSPPRVLGGTPCSSGFRWLQVPQHRRGPCHHCPLAVHGALCVPGLLLALTGAPDAGFPSGMIGLFNLVYRCQVSGSGPTRRARTQTCLSWPGGWGPGSPSSTWLVSLWWQLQRARCHGMNGPARHLACGWRADRWGAHAHQPWPGPHCHIVHSKPILRLTLRHDPISANRASRVPFWPEPHRGGCVGAPGTAGGGSAGGPRHFWGHRGWAAWT